MLPGEGIGIEVMAPCLRVLDTAAASGGFGVDWRRCPAGAQHYLDTGDALPKSTLDEARRADAILLGAMGLPWIHTPDGTEIAPQPDLRVALDLYYGVRLVRMPPGMPAVLADHRAAEASRAGTVLLDAVYGALDSGEVRPFESSGQSGTEAITMAVPKQLCDAETGA